MSDFHKRDATGGHLIVHTYQNLSHNSVKSRKAITRLLHKSVHVYFSQGTQLHVSAYVSHSPAHSKYSS
jgi:hypothetical protein